VINDSIDNSDYIDYLCNNSDSYLSFIDS